AVPECSQAQGGCKQEEGQDGCPVCQCGHNGVLCAALPSCLKGCLSHNNVTTCYTCACSPDPPPHATENSLELRTIDSQTNSRKRRQLPVLRRARPSFSPGRVQFRA
ncbi:unnamed protein product, partial [Meganyctiphanes norvegica]